MKLLRTALLSMVILFTTIYMISCNKGNNEFGEADTFNVDTIIVTPATDIEQAFEIGWAVTTTGYPAFFVQLYLSNDNNLDTLTDIKITDSGSADISQELNVPEETQFYFVQSVTGNTSQVTIQHNESSPDLSASGWETSKSFPNPSGTTKYIIGYFYNTPGLQIQYKRRLLAVPVTFK